MVSKHDVASSDCVALQLLPALQQPQQQTERQQTEHQGPQQQQQDLLTCARAVPLQDLHLRQRPNRQQLSPMAEALPLLPAPMAPVKEEERQHGQPGPVVADGSRNAADALLQVPMAPVKEEERQHKQPVPCAL